MLALAWSPGIGDPTVTGWLTVFAYFATAWMCLRAMMAEKAGPPRPYLQTIRALFRVLGKRGTRRPLPAKRSLIWLSLATLLALLGVNKQLDLQTLITEIGRSAAATGGWYDQRHEVQLLFIIGVGAIGLVVSSVMMKIAQGEYADFRLPFFGLTLVMVYVVIRAASFHYVDRLIGHPLFGSWFNFVFESTGIAIVLVAASMRVKSKQL